MTFPNYEYCETIDKNTPPDPTEYGTGWEYWSDRIVKDDDGNVIEHAAVWRRIAAE